MGSRTNHPIRIAAPCLALFAAASLCACHKKETVEASVDAGPPVVKEVEPNNRPEAAQVLSHSTVVQGGLSADPSAPDEDWYALESAQPQNVDLSVVSTGGDVVLEVLDQDRNRLAQLNSEGVGKAERFPNLGVKGRTLIKVTSAKKGTGGSYELTALFSEPAAGMEWEPNHRTADATPAQLGEAISGFTAFPQDEDYFRFELPAVDAGLAQVVQPSVAAEPTPVVMDGQLVAGADAGVTASAGLLDVPQLALKIELSGVEGVRHEVQVLSAAEAPLFSVKSKDAEALSLRNVGVRATDQVFYVVVKSAWIGTGKDAKRGYNPNQPYQLKVSLEEAGANAEKEPNDDRGHPTLLPLNGFREGFLSPKSDVDYYVLKTDVPVLARLQLSGVDRVDLQLSLVGPGKNGEGEVTLLTANDGAVKEPEMLNNVSCSGECFFKVEGAKRKVDGKWVADTENSEVPYRLSVVTLPDNGNEEREPNSTVETATPLTLGHPLRGTIYPKRDTDYFKLDLSGRQVKTPIVATLTGILKVDVGLYLHRVDEDGKLSLVQTSDRAKGDKPETIRFSADPGVYIFEVKDSKGRESNFQDSYQLSVVEGE